MAIGKFFTEIVAEVGINTGLTDTIKGAQTGNTDRMLYGLEKLRGGPRPFLDEDPVRDKIIATNSSYSGTDIVPIAQIGNKLITLGSIETISISVFREKEPVRVLGRSYVKGYTAGPRTIAGSITFVVFNRDPFWEILKYMNEDTNKTPTDRYSTPVGDQIAPINLILWFSNEYGRKSVMTLYAVEFNQEGQVHSINDIYSEKTVNYLARDYDVLMDQDDVQGFRNLLYERQLTGQFTDSYMVSLLEYQRKVEKQIQDTDNLINQINQERAKMAIVTFGLSQILAAGGPTLVNKLDSLVKKKQQLIAELGNVNDAIIAWSKSAYDSNTVFGGTGTAQHDNLRQSPVVGNSPYLKTRKEIKTAGSMFDGGSPEWSVEGKVTALHGEATVNE